MTNLKIRLLAAAAVMLVVEALCQLGLLLLSFRGIAYDPVDPRTLPDRTRSALESLLAADTGYVTVDGVLGWVIRPGAVHRNGYHATATGLRAPAVRSPLVSAYGDSFTHGDEVEDHETWVARIGGRNAGVPGYGLDQAFLYYLRDRHGYTAELILIGYMSENINRMVNTFRPFYSPDWLPFAKPRFKLRGDTLELVATPLTTLAAYDSLLEAPAGMLGRLGAEDLHWRTRGTRHRLWDALGLVRLAKLAASTLQERPSRYSPGSEAFRVTVAVFEAFADSVAADGREPVIVLFPTWADLIRSRYDRLRDTLVARGHRVVDVRDAFVACGRCRHLFSSGGHYNAQGNAVVADHLRRRLALDSRLDTSTRE